MVVRACARVSELKVLFGFWETLNFIIIGYFFKICLLLYFYFEFSPTSYFRFGDLQDQKKSNKQKKKNPAKSIKKQPFTEG